MGSVFDGAQAQLTKYFYERLPYTFFSPSLPLGKTTIFTASDLSASTQGKKMGITAGLATTQAALVSLVAESASNPEVTATAGYPPLLGQTDNGPDDGIRSTGALGLYVTNSSGAAVANFQTNYTVAVKQLTVADKILRGLSRSPREAELEHKFQIANQGLYPISISRMLENLWLSRITSKRPYAYQGPATVASTTLTNLVPLSGEILVVTSIAMGGVPVGNQVSLTIQRDTDLNYVSILGDNLSLDKPMSVWIPATKSLSFALSAVTTTAAVEVRFEVARIRTSFILEVMFGNVDHHTLSGVDLNLYEQVMAGVIA